MNIKRFNEELNVLDDPSLVGTGAVKYDGGKPSVWRGVINYFPRALWSIAEVSTFGANKYAWGGWSNVEEGYERYQDAKMRHMLKEAMGEEIDSDSNLMHLAHEAWGALAALELYLRDKEQCQTRQNETGEESVFLEMQQQQLYDNVHFSPDA